MNNKKQLIPVLGLMAFFANGDNYAAAPLLINISKELNVSISTAAMSVTAYMLTFGVFTLFFGPMSDKYGKVKIINIAAFGTAIFSILGAFSFNLPSLIFFRAMNGAFGAGIFPVTIAFIGQSFEAKNRHKAIASLMGLMFLGAATATAIGGFLSYFGSWRMVYMAYGISELIVAIIMLKMLERDTPQNTTLHLIKAYKDPFTNFKFLRLVITIFFVGFCVFGTFTYSGKLLKEITGYNILAVGLILSLFGLGTVIGGKIAPKLKQKFKHWFLVLAGIIGGISLVTLSFSYNIWIIGLALTGFGIAFIFLQSTLISTAQDMLPHSRGTAMSLASFNIFVGGAVGTSFNGHLIKTYAVSTIFRNASIIILIVGIIAAIFVTKFEKTKANN